MRASSLEFRLRMVINAAIIFLGFWSPWIEQWGIGKRTPLLEWLAVHLSRLGFLPFTTAATVVIIIAALVAAIAVILRVTGSAYLGPGTVTNREMQAGSVVVSGPYRYVRNPLYLGIWCMVAAMAFIMPLTGALVSMALITLFLFRLILSEEHFLSTRLGEPYRNYLRTTPRLIPRLRSSIPVTDSKPQWARALLGELTPIGVFIALAFFSWSYDNALMIRIILISFGVSLVVWALMPSGRT